MKFYSLKQLGPSGPPDLNKRTVYTEHHIQIAEFAPYDQTKGWQKIDDQAVDAYIATLANREETNDRGTSTE